MEKPAKKMGRPRAYANAVAMPSLKEPTKEVVNQGRRAGQPKSSRESEIRLGGRPISSPPENKRESGGHKKEGSDFGRIQSVPSVPESSGNEWRIRIVNQEHGPFRTIQAALEEALDGDIISISPGYYAEQLVIERDNVRIVGKVRDGGEVVMECTPEKWVFQANRDAGNCRLENLTIRSSAAAEQESNVVSGAKAGIAALKAKVKGGMFALARAEKDMVIDKKQGGYAAIVESGRVTFLHCSKCEN
jgi:pectin methylesterase-like acyl-CoA thioesterase